MPRADPGFLANASNFLLQVPDFVSSLNLLEFDRRSLFLVLRNSSFCCSFGFSPPQ